MKHNFAKLFLKVLIFGNIIMPVKKMKGQKKPKKERKIKQKQNVKQIVKVTVQSSGGSGGGGSAMPSAFSDRSGENVRLQNLVEQLAKTIRAPVSVPVSVPAPIHSRNDYEPIYNPTNDAETLKGVYQGESELNKPVVLGPTGHTPEDESAGESNYENIDIKRRGRKPGHIPSNKGFSSNEKAIAKHMSKIPSVSATIVPSGFEKM